MAYPLDGEHARVVVETAKTEISFTVEIADNPSSRARGLMYRDSLDDHHGMLFIFDRVQPVSMWMKNTYIPLDILFLDELGAIVHIAYSTTPLSLSHIRSRYPVLGVLEVRAGTARAQGITVGDRLHHPAFSSSRAGQQEPSPEGKNTPASGKDLLSPK